MNARVATRGLWIVCLTLAALWPIAPAAIGAEPGEGFRPIGKVQPRHAHSIAASNWSVGAETMDRDFTVYKHWRQHLGPLGVKKARIQSGWAKTEPQAGHYQWAWLDEIVHDMIAQGVTPWVCICYGNPAYPDGGGTGLGGGFPTSPEALAGWDRYVAALVKRYGAHVTEWEIWNEPGLHSVYGKKKKKDPQAIERSARDYADFFIRTARVVRGEQPQAQILGLSLPGMPLAYAEAVLRRIKEQNAVGLLDQLTYHPYKANPDESYEVVEKLREMARSYAPHVQLRQGENGAPSVKGGFGAIANHDWDEQSQACWALRRLLGDLGRDIPSSYFSICDMQYPDRVNYKGLLAINPDKTVNHVKQSYRAIQHLTAVFDSRVQRMRDFEGRVEGVPAEAHYALFAYRAAEGQPIVTLWRTERPPFEPVTPVAATVVLPQLRFTEPVWVEMVSGVVFQIDKSLWTQHADRAEFRGMPIAGAPVLIADRSAIPFTAAKGSR
jgi:hypothetical protein